MKAEDFYTRDQHNDGAEVEVLDQHGSKSGCFLTVVGADSDIWREISRTMQRDALLASFSEESESHSERRVRYLSKCVIGNRGFDGKMDNQRIKTMLIMAPYVADQVDKFIARRENFTRKPVKK